MTYLRAVVKAGLRGLLLDFDGTIARTEHGHRAAFNRAFAELGLDWFWSDELYADLLRVPGGKERLRYYVERYRPELLGRAVVDGLFDEIGRRKSRNFCAIAAAIPFRPGVQRLVYEAHLAGLRIAVATSASKAGVEALLDQDSAMRAMIDVIAAGDAIEPKKPAPDVYVRALERLGLAPGACVAIEDSPIGLRAALSAGLRTIVTITDYTANDDFSGAAAVLSDLGDDDRTARWIAGRRPSNGIVDLAFLRDVLAPAEATREPA